MSKGRLMSQINNTFGSGGMTMSVCIIYSVLENRQSENS